VVDITNKESPEVTGTVQAGEWLNDVVATDGYLYVASNSGLEIYDISNPDIPIHVGNSTLHPVSIELDYHGGYVYLRSTNGIFVVNVEEPAYPVLEGWVRLPGIGGRSTGGLTVSGGQAHVGGVDEVVTVDVSDPLMPVEIGRTSVNGSTVALRREGSIIYGYASRGGASTPFVLEVVADDVATWVGSHTVAEWTLGVEHEKGYAYRIHNTVFEIADEHL
jgi:hypothetical protein